MHILFKCSWNITKIDHICQITKQIKKKPWNHTKYLLWKMFGRVQLFATPWTVQSVDFSRPEHWSGWPFPSPGTFPNQGLNPGLPHCRQPFTSWAAREAQEHWSGQPLPSPGTFPAQGWNPGLLHCRRILYQLSHQGSHLLSPKWN